MEWLSELIGFLVVLFVFLLPVLRKFIIDKKQKNKPQPKDEYAYEEEEEYEEEVEEELPPPPLAVKKRPATTKRLVKKDYEFHTDIEEREYESTVEERTLGTRVDPSFKDRIVSQAFILPEKKRKKRSVKNPIVKTLQQNDPLHAMVILSEIFGPPKGL